MKIEVGERIKTLRDEMQMSQEAFAEKISVSVRQLSRIENNQASIDMLHFIYIMQVCEKPLDDFWALHFGSKEYSQYKAYMDIRGFLAKTQFDSFDNDIDKLNNSSILLDVYAKQLIMRREVREIMLTASARGNPKEVFLDEKLFDKLYAAINLTISNFNEKNVSEYLLTQMEINLLGDMSSVLMYIGENERATDLMRSMCDNRSVRMLIENQEERGNYFEYVRQLIDSDMNVGQYRKSISNAIRLHEDVMEYEEQDISLFCAALEIITKSYKLSGADRSVYMPYLKSFYHWVALIRYPLYLEYVENEIKNFYEMDLEEMF